MKLGMLTGLWYVSGKESALDSLERVAALGFRYVDLHGVFHAGPAHLSRADVQNVKLKMDALGLRPRNYVCHAPHNIPSADDATFEADLEYMQRAVDLALLWDVNQIMLNAGQWAFGVSRERAWSRSVRFFQRLCDFAAERDVFIVQEAEPYVWFLVNDVTSTVRIMEEVGKVEEVFRPPFHPYTYLLLTAVPEADPDQVMPPARKDIGLLTDEQKLACPFAPRCPWRVGTVCDEVDPPWQLASDTYALHCHIPLDELSQLAGQADLARASELVN